MRDFFQNISSIFHKKVYIFFYIFLVIFFGILWYRFTDFSLMKGNYGMKHYYYDTFLSIVNIFAFSLFIVAWTYRAYTLGSQKSRGEGVGFLWGILSILISWSICCGSSILTAFGTSILANFISRNPFLPFAGLELKTLGVVILLASLYALGKNLLTCRINTKKSSK